MALKTRASDYIKKAGKTGGKSNRLGSGGRSAQMRKKGMSSALIAWIGDRRHGADKMAKYAAEGKKREARK